MSEKTIYNLKLHETLRVNDCLLVRRVHMGWIYTSFNRKYSNTEMDFIYEYQDSVFVPKTKSNVCKNCESRYTE